MSKTLDWKKYVEAAVKTVAEGCVLLKNENNALPLQKDSGTAVFGRIQLHYYKSGTGSGGMVNVSKVVGITDGLIDAGVNVDRGLLDIYKKWDSENPYNTGEGWGGEPWSQKEMPLDDSIAADAAARCDTAIVVIGRTAGEEQDSKPEKGSYYLTDTELEMLKTVRRYFGKMAVLLNVGGIIDMSFLDSKETSPDALMIVWHGGMVGGTGTARVLTGEVSPSGKLPDTVAYKVSDHASDRNFGEPEKCVYAEDIYVGYRWFETFAKDKVRFPFGFGLSYTQFDISCTKTGSKLAVSHDMNATDGFICQPSEEYIYEGKTDSSELLEVTVKNTGVKFSGKEVVQIYAELPQGKLGNPARRLVAFAKTKTLVPGEEQTLTFEIDHAVLASYDDSGKTGNKNCFVLEEGEYRFYCGGDVRSAKPINYSFNVTETQVVSEHKQLLAPHTAFDRIVPEEVLSRD